MSPAMLGFFLGAVVFGVLGFLAGFAFGREHAAPVDRDEDDRDDDDGEGDLFR